MPFVCRTGDTGSHGGSITTGAPSVTANGLPVACNGDTYDCMRHGLQPLISVRPETAGGQSIVCIGDMAACGSVMETGSPNVTAG